MCKKERREPKNIRAVKNQNATVRPRQLSTNPLPLRFSQWKKTIRVWSFRNEAKHSEESVLRHFFSESSAAGMTHLFAHSDVPFPSPRMYNAPDSPPLST